MLEPSADGGALKIGRKGTGTYVLVVHGRAAVTKDGVITAFAIDDVTGIGPYSVDPRTSAGEANQAAAPTDVDVLPADEGVATPSEDLANGAIDNGAEASA